MRTDYTTAPAPVHVLQSDRYVRLYWPVEGEHAPDAFGCTPHYTLTFDHEGKEFRAIESVVPAFFPGDGTHREALTMGTRPVRTVIARTPAPRYSAPRFLAFVKSILSGPQAAN